MDSLMEVLTILLFILVFAIIILALIYFYISYREKSREKEEEKKASGTTTKVAKEYTTKSIFKFMQFDKIEDNMIVQDNEQKYLMVIECEGVNYDLMSQVEKTSVETGFVQFLNTLRFPIQLYTQTRTINIEDSIRNYKSRLDDIKSQMDSKQIEYNKMTSTENYNEKQEALLRRELLRIKNLYEYGQDIVDNIQKTSNNKNVLRKHYYIVVPYNSLEIGTDLLNEQEKKNMIFAELYTRAQSLVRALFSCSMKCKILNSNELVELLYIAYNRDETETYGLEKAMKAGYNELYVTAPDVLDKRMKALDKKIDEDALQLAKDAIDEVRMEKQNKIDKKESNIQELVREMAETLLKENEKYVGKDVTKKAIDKISKTEEGGNKNGKKAIKGSGKLAKSE